MKTLQQNSIRNLALPSFQNKVNRSENLYLDDIIYLKANSNYTVFVLQNGQEIMTGFSLNKYKKLERFNFVQTHRSFIINPLHIENFDFENYFLTMNNGANIDISRRRKIKLKCFFLKLSNLKKAVIK